MIAKSERLTVLSDAEQEALYGLPDFDAFFRFDWNDVQDDCAFVLSRYFHAEAFEHKLITKHEHYSQRERIAELFGYQPWAADFLPRSRSRPRKSCGAT